MIPISCVLIETERVRQIREEGWTAKHDDSHVKGELAEAASSYADLAAYQSQVPAAAIDQRRPMGWPFESKWWKPSSDPLRNLIKAGALIAAEIDRLIRLDAQPQMVINILPNPQPTELHIAYEVLEHPRASEEGNCPNLGREAEIETHEEAASRRGVQA
jgi:hypothetical protein